MKILHLSFQKLYTFLNDIDYKYIKDQCIQQQPSSLLLLKGRGIIIADEFSLCLIGCIKILFFMHMICKETVIFIGDHRQLGFSNNTNTITKYLMNNVNKSCIFHLNINQRSSNDKNLIHIITLLRYMIHINSVNNIKNEDIYIPFNVNIFTSYQKLYMQLKEYEEIMVTDPFYISLLVMYFLVVLLQYYIIIAQKHTGN
jgi:hypothetical protein